MTSISTAGNFNITPASDCCRIKKQRPHVNKDMITPSESYRGIVEWWDDKNITQNRGDSDRCRCMIPTR